MKKHLGILLAFTIIFNTSICFAKASVTVKSDPETEKIKIEASFDNESKVSVNVFNANFTLNAQSEQKYDDATFKKDFDAFIALSDLLKEQCVDNIKQFDKTKKVDLEYKSKGEKGRYAVYVVNEQGESAYKFFTFVKKADYPLILSEFNAAENTQKMEKLLAYYEDVFFTSPLFSLLGDESKSLISKELYDAKNKSNYLSMEDIKKDYELNATVLKFYEIKDDTERVKYLNKNAKALKISEIDSSFAEANDTYKSNVAEYILEKGAKCYKGFKEEFENAAKLYTTKKESSSQGGGSSSKGGVSGFVASNNVLNTQTNEGAKSIYQDLELSHWAYESVLRLTQRGIISGDGDSNFRPNDFVTRAEFIKMILTSMDLYDKDATASFNDVNENDWFYSYVASAKMNEIALGDENGNFNPNAKITRQDAVKIMHNAVMFKNYVIKEQREYKEFTDESDILEYALVPIKTMYCLNVINGYEDGSFKPTSSITRCEAAKMTFSFLQSVN